MRAHARDGVDTTTMMIGCFCGSFIDMPSCSTVEVLIIFQGMEELHMWFPDFVFFNEHEGCGAPLGLLECSVPPILSMFLCDIKKIVVYVRSLEPPNILKLWLVISKGVLPVK